MNNKDIIISIAADSSKFLKDMQQALASAEKQAKSSNISAIMEAKFKLIKKAALDCQRQFEILYDAFSNFHIDDTAFNGITGSLENNLKTVNKLSQNFKTFHIDIDKKSGSQLNSFMDQILYTLQMLNSQSASLRNSVKSITLPLQEMGDALSTQDTTALWSEMEGKVDQLFNSGNKLDKRTKVYKNAIKEIIELYDKYTLLGGSKSIDQLAEVKTPAAPVTAQNDPLKPVTKNNKSVLEALEKAYQKLSMENSAFQDLAQSALDAGTAKDRFTDSNLSVSDSAGDSSDTIDTEGDALENVSEKSDDAVSAVQSCTSVLKQCWETLSGLVTSSLGLSSVTDIINKLTASTIELDDSLTKMRMVSGESAASFQRFQKESFSLGRAVGAASQDIQKSAAGFLQLGYSIRDAGSLAQNANLYSRVGDMGIDKATEQILDSVKTWGDEFRNTAQASEAVIDRFAQMGASYSISAAELGDAVQKYADSLKSGGNTLNEAIGIITASSQLGQSSDTTVKALEVLSLRLRRNKEDLKAMGADVDGLSASSARFREEILNLSGVDIKLDNGSFKSTVSLIEELGAKYKELSPEKQSSLLKKLGGTDNSSSIKTLLENYDTLESVMNSISNSDGAAQEKNEIYLHSITGKIGEFKNRLDELNSTIMNSSFIKGLVDGGTKLLDILSAITDKLHAFPAIMGIVSGALTFKNFGRVKLLPV